MKSPQLSLLPAENPLRTALWEPFFSKLPAKPGAYKFLNERGDILYVGKAINLRRRLSAYKAKDFSKLSKKTQGLLMRVLRIDFTITEDELEALILEDEWIKGFKPPYNQQNTRYETYYFIHLGFDSDYQRVQFSLKMNANQDRGEHIFGSFKGHANVRKTLASLYRCLFILQLHPQHPRALQNHLLGVFGADAAQFRCRNFHQNQLKDFLSGRSFRLLRSVESQLKQINSYYANIEQKLLQLDLSNLYQFYYKNCVPLYAPKELEAFTAKKDVDQSLIRWSNVQKSSYFKRPNQA